MKKTGSRLKLLSALSLGFTALGLSACSSSNIVNVMFGSDNNVITVGQIDFSNYHLDVEYKNGDVEEIPVTESMIDKNDIFKLYKIGTHDITFYYDNFYTTATFIVETNHFSDDIKFVTNDKYQGEDIFIQKYDGKAHSLALTQNIPVGTQIIYPDGNSFTDSKNTPYVVRAILVKDGYESKEITGKLLIVVNEFPPEYFDQIVFDDVTVPYDGKEHSITIEELPNELEAEYKIYDSTGRKVDKAVDAGVYNVYVTFTSKNRNYTIPDAQKTKTAKLTIGQTAINCSGVTLEPIVKDYDGFSVDVLPLGFIPNNVSYNVVIKDKNGNVVNKPVDAGEYSVQVNFTTDSDHIVNPEFLTTTLTINKKVVDLSGLEYGLEETKFDGCNKRYSLLDNQLPNYVQANFTYKKVGSDEACTPFEPGKYIVDIGFEIVNENPNNYQLINVPTDSAVLIVNPIQFAKDFFDEISFQNASVPYDGLEHTIEVENLPDELNVEYKIYDNNGNEIEKAIEVGRYTVEATFSPKEIGYEVPESKRTMTATLYIVE